MPYSPPVQSRSRTTERKLLVALDELLRVNGYTNTTIDEVAEREPSRQSPLVLSKGWVRRIERAPVPAEAAVGRLRRYTSGVRGWVGCEGVPERDPYSHLNFNLPLVIAFGTAAAHFQAILRVCPPRRV
jgi:hypothetical protein